MIVVMKSNSPLAEIERVSQELRRWDITPEKLSGKHKVVIGLVGDTAEIDPIQKSQSLLPFLPLQTFEPMYMSLAPSVRVAILRL